MYNVLAYTIVCVKAKKKKKLRMEIRNSGIAKYFIVLNELANERTSVCAIFVMKRVKGCEYDDLMIYIPTETPANI